MSNHEGEPSHHRDATGGYGERDERDAWQELRAAKEYAEAIVETLHEPLLVLTPDLRVKSANPAFYSHFQVTPEEAEGTLIYRLGNDQWDIPELRRLLEDVLPDSNVFEDFEVTHEFEGVGRRTMLVNARRLDHVQLILLGIRDITERDLDAEALRLSEQRYRTLFEAMDEAYAVVEVIPDDEGKWVDFLFVEVNPAFIEHTGMEYPAGRTATQLLGTPNPRWAEVYGQVAETGVPVRFEEQEMTLGRTFDLFVFRLGGPGSRRVAVLFSDITARKQAEEELRESEARFRAFVTTSSNVIYRMSPDWSEMRMLEGQGFLSDMEEPSKRWPDRYIHPDDRASVLEAIEEAVRTRSMFELEHRVLGADGAFGWALSRAVPLIDDEGAITEWFGAVRDITERKEAEEALRRLTETLEARVRDRTMEVRTLASWVLLAEQRERERIAQLLHDDVQQTLHSLNIRMHNLFTQNGLDRENNEEVAEAFTILRSAVRGTRSLSAVINPPVLQHGGLGDALRWLADHMREWHELSVAVHVDLDEPVEIDEVRRLLAFHSVRELLFNVVKHAGVQHAELAARLEGDVLVLEVTDRGRGFDVAEALARKPAGFGLATIRERVRFHGGDLEVASTRGEGTRKTLRLPVA